MSYYPILLELEGKRALVVGGGRVAQRKIETLLAYGASVSVVSRALTPPLQEMVATGRITCVDQAFKENHLEGAFLVIAATDDQQANQRVSEAARRRGLMVNAVDQPSDCDFIVPSIVKRGDLLIAISTSGKSPAMAKAIRVELEKKFGEEYAVFLRLMGRIREAVMALGLSQETNSGIFHDLVASNLIEALAAESHEEAEITLSGILPGDVSVQALLQDLWDE
jgi:precorrin-2 dehydrogenase/sirohydrochlorin ferrochelatase